MTTDKKSPTWCVNAEHMMSVGTDGASKMCCMIRHDYNHMSNSQDYTITDRSLLENFNNPAAVSIRQALNSGEQHPACNSCWQEESAGRLSKRLRDNQIAEANPGLYSGLAKLELNLSNICNIRCKTCAPSVSSQWITESYNQLTNPQQSLKEYSQGFHRYSRSYEDDSRFWQDLEQQLPTIREFNFYGGEPFLSRRMWWILQRAVEMGVAPLIELHYNTNGTLWPKETELWHNFKSVNLSFSIDGIGQQFESMRYLADWTQVVDNMNKADQLRHAGGIANLGWCVTVSSLNVYYLPEIIQHYVDYYYPRNFGLYLNLVHFAPRWNISRLPQAIKDQIANKLRAYDTSEFNWHHEYLAIIDFMMSGKGNLNDWQDFKHQVQLQDQFRQENSAEIYPEFYQIIKEYDQ